MVTHAFMVGPALAGHAWLLLEVFESLASDPANEGMLAGLGAPRGWQRLNDEDVYFMLDLMSALSPS